MSMGHLVPGGLVLILLASLVVNLVAILYQLHILRVSRTQPEYTYKDSDRPRELPIKVRTVNMVFHDDPEHYRLSGDQAWAEWNEMRPEGKGFAYLGQEYLTFDVSMWHQLHCLNHIRTVLLNGDDGSDHVEHCFHYLRQGILCAADTTIEAGGANMLRDDGQKVATGVNVTHTCRDWKQIYDWLEVEHSKWTAEMEVRFRTESSDGRTHKGMQESKGEMESGHTHL
jgi:hypothetical protein